MIVAAVQPSDLCRAAIAINNMAVAMMERGAYEQAHESLKDAVIILRSAAPQESVEQEFLLTKLCRANRYLSKAHVSKTVYVPLCTISDDWTHTEVAKQCKSTSDASSAMLYPIRIEICNGDDLDARSCNDFAPSIVYNFSLTYFCLAKTNDQDKEQDAQGHLANAMRTMRMCGEMLTLDGEERTEPSNQDFMVALLCQRALIEFLSACGRHVDAAICRTLLEKMSAQASDGALSVVIAKACKAAPAA